MTREQAVVTFLDKKHGTHDWKQCGISHALLEYAMGSSTFQEVEAAADREDPQWREKFAQSEYAKQVKE